MGGNAWKPGLQLPGKQRAAQEQITLMIVNQVSLLLVEIETL